MTEKELQELSRQAAEKLPADILMRGKSDPQIGKIWDNDCWTWLHESTEACAEIMVRVLWPNEIYGVPFRKNACHFIHTTPVNYEDCGNDPMLAFRIAVLRALIAT